MTFLRRKALEISSWVTWLAAPGCREWAEGLEREVEFIESDWRALVWAIGSIKVLLEPREAPLRTKDEAVAAAREFFEKRRNRVQYFFVVCAVGTVLAGMLALQVLSGIWRTLDCAVLPAVGYLLYRLYRGNEFADGLVDPIELIAKYHSELERFQRFKNGSINWLLTAAMGLACIVPAFYDGIRDHDRGLIVFGIVEAAMMWLSCVVAGYFVARKLRRRIEELTSILALEAGEASV